MSDNYIQDNNIKVSVKTRIGIESPDEWYNILEVYNKFSLEELIIHPRVRTDYYRGDVNKEAFRLAIKESRNPVCYNGDIFTRNDYIAFLKDYAYTDENSKSPLPHCIMLGRGLVADPGLINVLIGDNPYEYARNLKEDKDNMRKLHNYVYEERLKIMSGDKHPIVLCYNVSIVMQSI
jgi:tRNA-dihydrouridine synthase